MCPSIKARFHGRFFSAKCEIFRLFLLNRDHSNKLFLLDCPQFKRNRRNISPRKSTHGIAPLWMSHTIFASCFLNLSNNYRGTNVVITSYSNVNPNIVTTFLRVHKKTFTQRWTNVIITLSYFNVNPNVVTTFLRVHKKTLTQRQYQRDLNVRRTFIQRLYNVIVLAARARK